MMHKLTSISFQVATSRWWFFPRLDLFSFSRRWLHPRTILLGFSALAPLEVASVPAIRELSKYWPCVSPRKNPGKLRGKSFMLSGGCFSTCCWQLGVTSPLVLWNRFWLLWTFVEWCWRIHEQSHAIYLLHGKCKWFAFAQSIQMLEACLSSVICQRSNWEHTRSETPEAFGSDLLCFRTISVNSNETNEQISLEYTWHVHTCSENSFSHPPSAMGSGSESDSSNGSQFGKDPKCLFFFCARVSSNVAMFSMCSFRGEWCWVVVEVWGGGITG